MKIDNYHDLRIPAAMPQRNTALQGDSAAATASFSASTHGAPAMRELGNALIVMQKAQMIVQQALSAASRMQNLAAEGIHRGSIDYSQINTELAQVSSSFEELSPSMRTQVGPVSESLLKANKAIDENKPQELDLALQESSALIKRETDSYIRAMGADELSVTEAKGAAASTLTERAIFVQGNISPERAVQLIG